MLMFYFEASSVVGDTGPWGDDHLSSTKTKWDLFYDPCSYGYCYGITFLSLSQITRYKSKRKEPNTDDYDIKLIQSFMKNYIPWKNSSGIYNDNNVNVCYNNFKYWFNKLYYDCKHLIMWLFQLLSVAAWYNHISLSGLIVMNSYKSSCHS
jgi:hypothetical protein